MENNVIIVFCGEGANSSIRGLMHDYANALIESGQCVVQLSFERPEIEYAVDLMRQRKVQFALTWLGFGQDLSGTMGQSTSTRNVFEFYQVPLVKLHGDLPAYYIDFHRDIPRNSVNLYQAFEFIAFRKAWLPQAQALTSLIPPMPMVPIERSSVDVTLRKRGKIFFIKNGNSAQALEAKWDEILPPRLARTTKRMARDLAGDHVRKAPIYLGDWVRRYLEAENAALDLPRELIWFFAAQMDDYLRRIKSTLIAEALLDFPVIVQGNFWDHIDFSGRRASRSPGMDVFSTQRVVLEELGVIDMSANVDTWPHDRVQRAAGSYSLVLTNRQSWLTERFPAFQDLMFDFDPHSIAARIDDVLSHRERYLELALEFGDAFRVAFPRQSFAETVLTLVDYTRWLCQDPRPQLQDFFVWSRISQGSTAH